MTTTDTQDFDGGLTLKREGPVAIVTLNRPEKLNPLGAAQFRGLSAVMPVLDHDGRTRVVIITGAGKAFSAGGDIESFGDMNTLSKRRQFQYDAIAALATIERSPLTVIAAVNGWAMGGGCELAMACDITLAAESAKFAMPETALAMIPGYGVAKAAALIGRQMTMLMVTAGERLTAQRAYEVGLVQKVVPDDKLMEEALALAARVARNSPLANGVAKRVINRDGDQAALEHSLEATLVLAFSDDHREGVAAFLEKRPPVFGERT